MTYNIVASGSQGNAVILDDIILVDCGVPFEALLPYFKRLRLVLLTHQHSDHFNPATIKRLHYMRPGLRFAVPPWLYPLMCSLGVDAGVTDSIKPERGMFYRYAGGIFFSSEEIPHDVPNVCWKIHHNGDRVFYATDCGSLDDIEAKDYDLYLIEANHTQAELAARLAEKERRGEYAYERRAAEVHLSQEQALDWLAENATPRSRYVFIHQHRERGENRVVRSTSDDGATPENAEAGAAAQS